MNICILVADSGRARIFESDRSFRALTEREDFIHEESRLKNLDLVDDAAGKSVDMRGSLDPATQTKVHEEARFAKYLVKHLEDLHTQDPFDGLVVVAAPKFLGMLRSNFNKLLDELLVRTIDKDLTQFNIRDIADHLKS
jgi:protein required for attachment to host cells